MSAQEEKDDPKKSKMAFNDTLKALWTQILFKVIIFIVFIIINDLVEKFTGQKLVKIQFWKQQPTITINSDPSFNGPPIFFVETSSTKSQFLLTEACAIEAAARAHPQSLVFVFANNPTIINTTSSIIPIPRNKNIIYRTINTSEIFQDTRFQGSSSWFEFLADHNHNMAETILRIALLYKHGGISLTKDVLTLKSMSQVRNAIPTQNAALLGDSAFIFDRHHWFLGELIQEILLTHNSTLENNMDYFQTPAILRKVFDKVCGVQDGILEFIYLPDACNGLLLMPPYLFYPLIRTKWYLNLEGTPDSRRGLWDQSYAVYVWNSDHFDQTVRSGSGVLMDIIAREACPELHILGIIQQLAY